MLRYNMLTMGVCQQLQIFDKKHTCGHAVLNGITLFYFHSSKNKINKNILQRVIKRKSLVMVCYPSPSLLTALELK